MIYFVTVNYGTSNLIEEWVNSIKSFYFDATIVLVDNFKSDEERKRTINISNKLQINLILSDNIGYGRGLNKGIKYCFELSETNEFIVFAGNLDIEYINIPKDMLKGKYVYVPIVEEYNRKNRNPFLNNIQKSVFPIYFLAGYCKSIFLLYMAIAINKLLANINSPIWAIHGSLFCFHSTCLINDKHIFNEKSFLYCEELEFASYMEKYKIKFIDSDIKVIHHANATTREINKSKKDFFKLWWPSFKNWDNRWK